ncbi:hypothetical protein STANM309S_06780 [Streptomyces tanashiensis]
MTENGESTFTVIVAAVANLGIAAAKVVAGIVSGSSAMLSEAAHSVADTVTEAMLLTALKRSEKPADEDHPVGYAGERYVWALLAAVATFVGGAVFSLYDGIHTLTHGEEVGDPTISYIVLGIAFVLEGFSLRTGIKQVRAEAERMKAPFARYLRLTADTTVKAVVMEDSAALAGLMLAAGGLLGVQITGSDVWDGVASILIGLHTSSLINRARELEGSGPARPAHPWSAITRSGRPSSPSASRIAFIGSGEWVCHRLAPRSKTATSANCTT